MKSTQYALRNLHRIRLMTEKHTVEFRSLEAWKAINLFCGKKFRFTNCVNAESIDKMKLRIKDHYAAVLNQAPSDNLEKKFFSDSSPLTHKHANWCSG